MVKKQNEKLKVNINFLDRPLFFPSRRLNGEKIEDIKIYDDDNGFVLRSFHGLPTYTDKKILYFLMSQVQEEDGKLNVEVDVGSYYRAMQKMGLDPHQLKNARRFKESVDKWTNVTLTFEEDKFYLGDQKYTAREKSIHILKGSFPKDRKHPDQSYRLTFDEEFLSANFLHKYRRQIILDHFSSFKRPFAARLFEILCKSFWFEGTTYEINIKKLFKKMGADFRYLKDGVNQVQKAIEEIKEVTSDVQFIRFSTNGEIMEFYVDVEEKNKQEPKVA